MAYSNYPKTAIQAARRALKYADQKGWGSCGTAVGKNRANQIAAARPLSDETVKRVYSFLSRHEKNSAVPYGEGCGGLMYDAWGGKSMLPWAKRTVEKMEEDQNKRAAEMRRMYGESVEVRTSEVRAASDETGRVIEGYAAVFNQVTDIGTFKEVIDPGAFDGRLNDDVRLMFNHEGQPLARTTNNTLTLTTDETGLKYRAELADTTAGRDLYELIKTGNVSQSSFAFTIEEEERESSGVRRVKKVSKLLDVAPVVFPAYDTPNVVTSRKKEPDNKPEETPSAEKRETKNKMDNTRTQTVSDLQAKRAQVSEEMQALSAGIESEDRTAHSAETEQLEKYAGELEKLDGFIKMRQMSAEATARMAQVGTTSVSEGKALDSVAKSFSLSRAISAVSNGRNLLGAELELAQEAQNEMRNAGVNMRGQVGIPAKLMQRTGTADNFQADAGQGSAFVPTVTGPAIGGLYAPSVMEQLGTNFIQATGNLEFPKVTSPAVGNVLTEVADANNGTPAAGASTLEMGSLSLVPQRVMNTTTYSKQLLLQGGAAVDQLLTRELIAGVNQKIDQVCFATLATDAGEATPEINVDSDVTLAYATLTNMEKLISGDGADLAGAVWAVSPAIMAKLRALVGVDGISAAMDSASMSVMGYRVISTPHATGNTFYLGNWGQGGQGAKFGGLDVLVDPFSAAGTSQTRLYCTQFFDYGIRQGGAIAANITIA